MDMTTYTLRRTDSGRPFRTAASTRIVIEPSFVFGLLHFRYRITIDVKWNLDGENKDFFF